MEIMEDIIPFNIQRFSKDHPECDDVLLNFVAADVSSIPPGKFSFGFPLKWAKNFSVKILNRVKSRTFNENGDKGKLYRSYDFSGDEKRIEACGMMMKVFF